MHTFLRETGANAHAREVPSRSAKLDDHNLLISNIPSPLLAQQQQPVSLPAMSPHSQDIATQNAATQSPTSASSHLTYRQQNNALTLLPVSAAARVLNLPELLEHIFLGLPMADLLRIQRVNHTWLSTITSSPDLQKALFLLPSACPIPDQDSRGSHDSTPAQQPYTLRQIINPMLVHGITGDAQADKEVNFTRRALWSKDSSCEAMLMTQPTIDFTVRIEAFRPDGRVWCTGDLPVRGGQKWGDFRKL